MLGVHAQQLDGSWKGTLNVGQQKLTMILHIDKDKPSVTIDIPEQGGENIPMEVKHLSADSIHVTLSKNNASYEGKLSDGQLKGVFKQSILALQLNFEPGDFVVNRPQEPHPPYPYTTEEVRFVNPVANDTLAGTLTYPIGFKKKKAPVVLMVTGSGPQNRDEQVLRYDDRGTGASTGNFGDATTADFADDARAGIQFLRNRKEFRKVGILGHSEGGAIAFMLGSEAVPDFIVSLAGPAGRIDTMMVAQLNLIGRSQGMTQDMVKTTKDARNYLTMADKGKWMSYFIDMDLSPYVRKTFCPVFALGGEKDLNVPPSFNTKALEENLPQNKFNVIKVYPGLSHLFHHCTTGNPSLAFTIEETISPEVLNDISGWILSLGKKK